MRNCTVCGKERHDEVSECVHCGATPINRKRFDAIRKRVTKLKMTPFLPTWRAQTAAVSNFEHSLGEIEHVTLYDEDGAQGYHSGKDCFIFRTEQEAKEAADLVHELFPGLLVETYSAMTFQKQYICLECLELFPNRETYDDHQQKTGHKPGRDRYRLFSKKTTEWLRENKDKLLQKYKEQRSSESQL